MKQYTPDKIKNILIAGHGGSGKTTLTEALLYKTGATDRLGRVADGNTVSDYDPEEIKRKVSLLSVLAPFEHKGYKFNLIDAPGLFDFAGGFYEGLKAAGSVLITVSGKSGVTVGVKNAYKNAVKYNKARAFFVGKLDTEHADFYKVLADLKAAFGPSVCPVTVPHYANGKVECYVDLINNKAFQYDADGKEKEVPIPESEYRLDGLRTAISEAVAETDEALFEKYFSGEQFTQEELVKGVHEGVQSGSITPVFCGSAYTLEAIDMLLYSLCEFLPTAAEEAPEIGVAGDEMVELACDPAQPAAAYIFKTVADPFGRLSFFKVYAGKISADLNAVNASTSEPEKIGKLVYLRGKKQEETKEVSAGDIGVAVKITANTGDTLCDPARVVKIEPIPFPHPCYSMAVTTKNKGDEGKISQAIQRLLEEDPTLGFTINTETKQQILSGLGDQHLEVAKSKLKSKFGVDVDLVPPIVAYRETIRKKVKAEGKHKKQTGGHGQFGHVWIEFEPCDSDSLVFEEKVFGGAVPKGYFPAVEKGLQECVKRGVLAGYPVVGLKATLVDGSYHPVDSSEMAFKTAASLAYRKGLEEASPILLEPIGILKVVVPDANTGDMMGELNKKRGRVMGMNPDEEGMTCIEAEVPMSEMQDFAMLVRQITQGAGWFNLEFARYEQLPAQLEASVIEAAKSLLAE